MRYSFGDFVLSPSSRVLLRAGREVELAPRYLDLLLLLVRRRGEAITRREILDTVWSDVVVTDGALSQAVRTLRRALGDAPQSADYIRTVSRFGYQFVHPEVVEGDDTVPLPLAARSVGTAGPLPEADVESALAELVSDAPEEARRAAAATLHALGTREAVGRLREVPGSAGARAILRDVRWDLPRASEVPILGEPEPLATVLALVGLRFRRVLAAAGSRFAAAVLGATGAGVVAGLTGGALLLLGPGSLARPTLPALLGLVGALIGAAGGTGVGAGLCCAEVLFRSRRGLALALCGALGGGIVGVAAHSLARFVLEGLFGQDLSPVTGGLEGLVIGGATGLGFALATPSPDGGMATPHGARRWRAALLSGVVCAAGAAILGALGSRLGATSLDLLAHRFPGSTVSLAPLARMLGETAPGSVTRIVVGAWEGLMFATGTVLGLTHRPGSAS